MRKTTLLKSSLISGIIVVLLLLSYQSAWAAILRLNASNELIGADGVEVNGTLYDVRFVEDSAYNLFYTGGSWNFDFTSQDSALDAAHALSDQVITGIYDDDPSLTYGLTGTEGALGTYGSILTPYTTYIYPGSSHLYIRGIAFTNHDNERNDAFSEDYYQFFNAYSTADHGNVVYAVWSVSSVPVPGSFFLLMAGMFFLTGFGRKK